MAGIDDPFKRTELLGFFRWNAQFTEELKANDAWFYTAMHEKRLRTAIRTGRLVPRGSFDTLVKGELIEEPCSWTALQDWHRSKLCNHFGPFIVSIRLRELEGRRFYVYRRLANGWRRYYFVQREEREALFSTPAKRIDPHTLFTRAHGVLTPRAVTQYEVLLTTSVSLAGAKVEATAHSWCASNSEHCYERLDRKHAIQRLERALGCDLPRRKYMVPQPFPLRHVIPPAKLISKLHVA